MKNHVKIIEELWTLTETLGDDHGDPVRELCYQYEVDSWTELVPELESRLKSMFELQNLLEELKSPPEIIDDISDLICEIKSEFITRGELYLSNLQKEYIYSI